MDGAGAFRSPNTLWGCVSTGSGGRRAGKDGSLCFKKSVKQPLQDSSSFQGTGYTGIFKASAPCFPGSHIVLPVVLPHSVTTSDLLEDTPALRLWGIVLDAGQGWCTCICRDGLRSVGLARGDTPRASLYLHFLRSQVRGHRIILLTGNCRLGTPGQLGSLPPYR